MKKLSITKEAFEKSNELKQKYGKLKYVSESGRYFKTDKGKILKFVKEAREYIDDNSIDTDSVEEFILFDDPTIFQQIAKLQTKKGEEIQDEVKSGEVNANDVALAAANASKSAAKTSALGAITSSAISSGINVAGNIVSSKATLGVAAALGYKKILDKAAEVGAEAGEKVGDAINAAAGVNDAIKVQDTAISNMVNMNRMAKQGFKQAWNASAALDPSLNINSNLDRQAVGIARQLNVNHFSNQPGAMGSREEAMKWLTDNGYEYKDGNVMKKAGGAAITAGAGAAGASGATSGWTLFGLSASTIGWIAAGVAAAAIITPYIYDKVRACSKTWLADIIAEVKFKADGKKYRCFYDLKENKWVLTYADIKWGSYLDNKLDKETQDEFFASKFFNGFLSKCRNAFAMLFATSKNEAVFKTLEEIKDAPKDLKKILEKIYDNKGAISKNMFAGKH